jgi:hypothetical protein
MMSEVFQIRIKMGQWIKIRIGNPDPDPGGKKLSPRKGKKLRNYMFKKFYVLAGGFYWSLNALPFWSGSGLSNGSDPTPFFGDFKHAKQKIFFIFYFLELTRRHIIFSPKNVIFAKILC